MYRHITCNVLEKLEIQFIENGNKISFEYNGKQYSLVFSSQSDVSQICLTIDDSVCRVQILHLIYI